MWYSILELVYDKSSETNDVRKVQYMLWLGIGILIVGLALLILAIVSIKPLFKLAGVLSNVQKTTKELPKNVDTIISDVSKGINQGLNTLSKVNGQIKQLNPFFQIIGDVGRATNQLSNSIVQKVYHTDTGKTSTPVNLKGFYALIALVYLLFNFNKKR